MLSQEELAYLEVSPLTSDVGSSPREVLLARMDLVKELPRNIQNILESEETAAFLRSLVEQQTRLTREQTRRVADLLRSILLGERSAVSLREELQRTVGIVDEQAEKLARTLTEKFVTPNYFQIAQVYEKKHKGEGVTARTTPQRGTATAAPPPMATAPPPKPPLPIEPPRPPAAAPPRVVDLRNGTIPSRLPATPPPLTSGGFPAPRRTTDEPPTTPSRPAAPPPPPSREAPSPDALLKTLEKRAAPPSQPSPPPPPLVRPSETGSHGPLPPPASV